MTSGIHAFSLCVRREGTDYTVGRLGLGERFTVLRKNVSRSACTASRIKDASVLDDSFATAAWTYTLSSACVTFAVLVWYAILRINRTRTAGRSYPSLVLI